MKKTIIKNTIFFVFIVLNFESQSQNIESPKIIDFKWLSGNWVGDGFGGISQEVWTEPSVNSMVGVYKHYKDGKPTFYEFMNISENDGKISLRLKHFNPDMSGWEEKTDFVEFPFVSATQNKIEFKGLIYELIDNDTMIIHLKLNRGGEVSTEVFNFKKMK